MLAIVDKQKTSNSNGISISDIMKIDKEKLEREIVSEVFIMSIIHQTAPTE